MNPEPTAVAKFTADIFDGGPPKEWLLDSLTIGSRIPTDPNAAPVLFFAGPDDALPRLELPLKQEIDASLVSALNTAYAARPSHRPPSYHIPIRRRPVNAKPTAVAKFTADIFDGGPPREWLLDSLTIGIRIPTDPNAAPVLFFAGPDDALPRLELSLSQEIAASLVASLNTAHATRPSHRPPIYHIHWGTN